MVSSDPKYTPRELSHWLMELRALELAWSVPEVTEKREKLLTAAVMLDELQEARDQIKNCAVGPCPVLAHFGLKELV